MRELAVAVWVTLNLEYTPRGPIRIGAVNWWLVPRHDNMK